MPHSRQTKLFTGLFSSHKSGRYVVDITGFLGGKEGERVDLHAFFTDRSHAIEVMPVTTDAMCGSVLLPGGFVLIRTTLPPIAGSIVVVRYNSQVVLRRLFKREGKWTFIADNQKEKDLLITK